MLCNVVDVFWGVLGRVKGKKGERFVFVYCVGCIGLRARDIHVDVTVFLWDIRSCKRDRARDLLLFTLVICIGLRARDIHVFNICMRFLFLFFIFFFS